MNENMSTYKGTIFDVDVVVDLTHGWTSTIQEVYIPEKSVAMNSVNGDFNCFRISVENGNAKRYKSVNAVKVTEIDVPAEMVDMVVAYIDVRDELKEINEWVIDHVTKPDAVDEAVENKSCPNA